MYRLIAVDLDGTLLSPSGQVTPRTKNAIHAALKAGLLVCFATGRNLPESETVLEAVAHYDSAVFAGGAVIIDTRQRLRLHRTLMDGQLAREVCQFLEEQGHAVLALQDRADTGFDYLVSQDIALHPATQAWLKATQCKAQPVDDMRQRTHEHTMRLSIAAPRQEVQMLLPRLQQRFGSRVVCHSIGATAPELAVLEVFDPAVNKWEGIMHIARLHGIAAEQIIAVGDDVNDLVMLKNAGLGVAMGNACPEVKAVAKRVIGHHADDGLAQFLEELLHDHVVEPVDLT